jgi:hypothetical protein
MKITEEIITELGFVLDHTSEETKTSRAIKYYKISVHDIDIEIQYAYLEGWVAIISKYSMYTGHQIETLTEMMKYLYYIIHTGSVRNTQKTIKNSLGIK